MKILVLGGTQFVGRHIVEALVRAGHSVSILNRGKSVDELPEIVERLRGDRDLGSFGLDALTGRTWDVCVDVSGYLPRQVRSSAEKLRGKVSAYAFISAVSVYGDPESGPVLEANPRLPLAGAEVTEINQQTYGQIKVACEDIVQEVFGGRCALLRPQIIAGRHDPIDRFSYWVRRAAEGGEMLAPGNGCDHVQFIDARDVAMFTRLVCENALCGSFNLAGRRLTWGEFMKVLGARNIVWVSAGIIRGAGVREPELPLYRRDGEARSGLMHVSNERAVEAGLTLTDPNDTVRDVRAWLAECELRPTLSPEREAELIRLSRSRGQ